jgi:hypothetical protein
MRGIFPVLALSTMGLLMSAAESGAEITYPWCAQYQRDGRNCGFSTLEQCRATVSGNGGYCEENAMYRPNVGVGARRIRR